MARPRSDDKREAILDAAVRVIAAQGLSAPTATIAREAGVANGSLFTYFPTKADLLNTLYVELKTEMAATAKEGFSPEAEPRDALRQAWAGWLAWASRRPDGRRVLTLLGTLDEITEQSRQAGHVAMAPLAKLMENARAHGPMRNVNIGFVAALMNATAEATIDFIASDPRNATRHTKSGFEALWRMIA